AGCVVAVGGGAAVRADQLLEVTEAIVDVAGGDPTRVFDLGEAVLGVVVELGDAVQRVGDIHQPVQRVEGLGVAVVARVGGLFGVVVEVVAVLVGLLGGADAAQQAAEFVVDPALLLGEAAGGVLDALGGAVAHGVEVELQGFAQVVLDGL